MINALASCDGIWSCYSLTFDDDLSHMKNCTSYNSRLTQPRKLFWAHGIHHTWCIRIQPKNGRKPQSWSTARLPSNARAVELSNQVVLLHVRPIIWSCSSQTGDVPWTVERTLQDIFILICFQVVKILAVSKFCST